MASKLPKTKTTDSPTKVPPQYTDEEIAQLLAAAVAKLKAGDGISDEEAKATLSGFKGVTSSLENLIGQAAEFYDQVESEFRKTWKVRPNLEPMLFNPAESGIGKRIAYCRGQLDNLPIEALARYTKNFGEGGISRASLVRYESGDTMPGARELRILCDALWVPANWLMYGAVDAADENSAVAQIAQGLRRLIRQEKHGVENEDIQTTLEDMGRKAEIEKRQKWMIEARKPQPRS